MSIFGYLERGRRGVPGRAEVVTAITGEEVVRVVPAPDPVEEEKRKVYLTVDDYDPVLRSHCRL